MRRLHTRVIFGPPPDQAGRLARDPVATAAPTARSGAGALSSMSPAVTGAPGLIGSAGIAPNFEGVRSC